jgi:preprotein translocase subunit SecA
MAGQGTGAAAAPAGYADEDDEDFEPLPAVQQRVVSDAEKLGRNDPCWCGSGKKFKKCHGAGA